MTLKDNVRRILESHGLPSNVAIEQETDPRFAARYFPRRDVLAVRDDTNPFLVLHEGAHAEHYGKLDRRGKPFDESLEFQVGFLLASECYVGQRLATIEETSLGISPSFPDTFMELAQQYSSPRELLGGCRPGVLFEYAGIRVAMRILPLLGVEVATGELTKRHWLSLAGMCSKAWLILGFRFSRPSSAGIARASTRRCTTSAVSGADRIASSQHARHHEPTEGVRATSGTRTSGHCWMSDQPGEDDTVGLHDDCTREPAAVGGTQLETFWRLRGFDRTPTLDGLDLIEYRHRVERVLREHFMNDPTLQRIRAGKAVREDELDALAKLQVDDKANLEHLKPAAYRRRGAAAGSDRLVDTHSGGYGSHVQGKPGSSRSSSARRFCVAGLSNQIPTSLLP